MQQLTSIKQTFTVSYQYQLYFTQGLFSLGNTLLKSILESYSDQPVKILVVLDQGVAKAHGGLPQAIKAYGEQYSKNLILQDILIVEGGESAKIDASCTQRVLSAINEHAICRHSFVLVIGGGAVIDMAGYAAAIAHRGVKLIRIPTTVLAQNDAAVGVKNSINHFGKKNFLGTFAPPFAIINDIDFLASLNQRDWISGIAEAIKVAAIKDAPFFAFLEKSAKKMANRDLASTTYMIHRCAELHMQHIAQGGDPFEGGSSRPLDFGHWAAHKLEQMTQHRLRHGEAVAMGIALDVTYAHEMGLVSQNTLNRVLKVLLDLGFDLKLPVSTTEEINTLLQGLEEFREHLGGILTITLLKEIGHKYDVNQIDLEVMKKAIAIRKQVNAVSL